jgi:hypothetical protein
MQHADDLDHTFLGNAIVENVNLPADLCAFRTAGKLIAITPNLLLRRL